MTNPGLKAMAGTRELKLGHFIVEFATPGIGYILKHAGCDFALLDTEHSGFHHETMKSALRYFEAARLPTIVRVPSKSYHHVARALDMGAEGLMVPMVGTAEEARAVLDCMKYTPHGLRGVALGIAHDTYAGGAVLDKLAAANARTTFVAQIETAAGVENVDAIAAVDGVDCLWVGHFDLSCSLGIPGQFEHKTFKDATARVLEACDKHGKSAGRLVPDVSSGVALNKDGFDFICYSGDVWALGAAVKAGLDDIRSACAAHGGAKQSQKKAKTA